MADLPTNLKDDILDSSVNTRRKYRMIENEDGTYSFEDVTEYSQVGDEYGAGLINETNRQVNERVEKAVVVRDLETIGAITQPGFIPDALALKDVNDSLGGLSFGYDETTQKYGYYKKEADTDVFVPFSGMNIIWENDGTQTSFAKTSTIEFDTNGYSEFIVFFCYGSNEILSAPAHRPHIGVRVTAKDTTYSVMTVSSVVASGFIVAGRKFKITDSGLSFTDLIYSSDNSPATRGLPVKIYGIK